MNQPSPAPELLVRHHHRRELVRAGKNVVDPGPVHRVLHDVKLIGKRPVTRCTGHVVSLVKHHYPNPPRTQHPEHAEVLLLHRGLPLAHPAAITKPTLLVQRGQMVGRTRIGDRPREGLPVRGTQMERAAARRMDHHARARTVGPTALLQLPAFFAMTDGPYPHFEPLQRPEGRLEYETPLGKTSVVGKKVGPVWYPTDTIREEYAARGEPLPRMVLPGPDNPLGSHAIYLGLPTYLIHGTNRPYSIGMRVSFGCVRLYPEDIVELYDLVAPGTPVRLVDERVKAGWVEDEIYLEVHPNPDPPQEEVRPNMTDAVRAIIKATPDGRQPPVDWKLVEATLTTANGIPALVGRRVAEPKLATTRHDAPRNTPSRSS